MAQRLGLDRLAAARSSDPLAARTASTVKLLTLAIVALSLVTLQGPVLEPIVLGSMLVASLAVLVLARSQILALVSQPAVGLLLAAMGTFLAIASAVLLIDAPPMALDLVARQGFFSLVALAVAVGAGAVLRTETLERLLVPLLWVFTAGCATLLLTPLLARVGLPEFRVATRLSGTFSDPNAAGLLAAATVTTSLVLLLWRHSTTLARLGLVLGCAATFATFSYSGVVAVCLVLVIGLRSVLARATSVLSSAMIIGSLLLAGSFVLWTVGILDAIISWTPAEDGVVSVQMLRHEPQWEASGVIDNRFTLWRKGIECAAENPLVGKGLRGLDGDLTGRAPGVHNVYIMLVGEAGVVPLWLWLCFLYRIVRDALAGRPSLRSGLLGLSLLVIAVFGLFHHGTWAWSVHSALVGLIAAIAGDTSSGARSAVPRSAADRSSMVR